MRTKTILIAASAALLVLVAGGLLYLRATRPLAKPATPAEVAKPVPPKVCDPAWSCGHLARGEAGMKPGVWYLKYQDVTGPVQLEVVFAAGAVCQVNGVVADCAAMNPPSGSAASFSGSIEGNVFVATKLAFTTKR